ncbi:hypothetical protein ACFOU2_00105 [Bacillus songklensis]|uniref:Uncharacterized protein n=2 Tax=Bacillus songklensis TaxID=1069116 RepID=A0ABV8AYK5_9BACI
MHSRKQIESDRLRYQQLTKSTLPQNQQKPNKTTKTRKKRSDAKVDVKIPLTTTERQQIRLLAKIKDQSTTECATNFILLYMNRNWDFKEVEYSSVDKKFVHAKFKQKDYDTLFGYAVKWDCSVREAAYRMLATALRSETGGIEIVEIV